MYNIIEIFTSFQGEGIHLGSPANFIRLAGCNLSCDFCDTNYNPSRGKVLSVSEITKQLKDVALTVITGGEPTIHNLLDLLLGIRSKLPQTLICLETNGTNPVTYPFDWITCSPKPQHEFYIHEGCFPNELKYVVTKDFDPSVINYFRTSIHNIWLQPDGNDLKNSVPKTLEIASKTGCRVGIQMHKHYNFE